MKNLYTVRGACLKILYSVSFANQETFLQRDLFSQKIGYQGVTHNKTAICNMQ